MIWLGEFADTIFMACGIKLFFSHFVSPRVLKRAGFTPIVEDEIRMIAATA